MAGGEAPKIGKCAKANRFDEMIEKKKERSGP
jgi:hypothetical protein